MKTPEEIKRGLECCYSPVEPMLRCEACPYYGSIVCTVCLHTDALAYIRQLAAQNAKLVKQVEQLKADKKKIMETAEILSNAVTRLELERDAAVADLAAIQECSTCKHDPDDSIDCIQDVCFECCTKCNWEWRGVPEKEV